MGISIKNDEVEGMIREFATLTGESVTDAVGVAVREALLRRRRYNAAEIQARSERIDRTLARIRALPVRDPRPMDELLYDEDGLPR